MNTNTLLNKASELTDKIYKSMSRIEQCDALSEEIADKVPVFLNGNSYVSIDNVLTEEQIKSIRDFAIDSIKANKSEAEKFLNGLVGSEEVVEEVIEEVIEDDPEEIVEEEQEEIPDPELDYDLVKHEVTKTNKTYREIADYFNVPYKKFYTFLEKNGLKRPKTPKGDWRG